VMEQAMNNARNNDKTNESPKPRPGQEGAHLPPDVARADVDRAKDMEADLNASQPEEPILQMREGRRRKKRQST
jgi:hypothetical protein